ncbi:MAG: class I SAM-dependent methyltransferase [Phycisphaerales bacterium]
MSRPEWTISDPEFQADAVVPLNPVYPWSGHRNFAYDLVRWVRPGRIVELGVHWGTSFFAFAQAIKDEKLPTRLIGVDTFKGDEHAGAYGGEVLAAVRTVIDRYFPTQDIVLHEGYFNDALPRVEDESVDILHIDGLHTHEACRCDYAAWLPKLAPEGVVLFHDTAPSTGYGSASFWKEIAARHPSFAFEHSWGLGVLFPKGSERLAGLRAQRLDERIMLYTHRAEHRLARIEVRDLTAMMEERGEAVQSQKRMMRERDERIARLADELQAAHERKQELVERQKQVVGEREAWTADLRRGLEAARALAADRDALVERLSASDQRLAAAESMARERYDKLQDLRRAAADREQRLRDTEHERDAAQQKHEQLSGHMDRVNALHERRKAEAAALQRRLKEQQAVNDELKARLERLETDVELLSVRSEHVEDIIAAQRTQLAALMETRVGRRAARRLAERAPLPSPVIMPANRAPAGSANGSAHGSALG